MSFALRMALAVLVLGILLMVFGYTMEKRSGHSEGYDDPGFSICILGLVLAICGLVALVIVATVHFASP